MAARLHSLVPLQDVPVPESAGPPLSSLRVPFSYSFEKPSGPIWRSSASQQQGLPKQVRVHKVFYTHTL